MCLLIIAYDVHPEYRLIVAANRDEFHHRSTAPAGWWTDEQQILAGRDLEAGGTWLGITIGGRFAAVTNFREPGVSVDNAPSRGGLVAEYLRGFMAAAEYVSDLAVRGAGYNGFNLMVGDSRDLWWLSNRGEAPECLKAGIYGLSNHLLDTPWPKVRRLTARLGRLLKHGQSISVESLFEVLSDRRTAPDEELPDTGVGLQLERFLSPPCIVGTAYGTRSSTVVLEGRGGDVVFSEKCLAADGSETGRVLFNFSLDENC